MGDSLTSKFTEASRFLEEENTILLGQQGGSISGLIERAPAAVSSHSKDAKKQRDKDSATGRLLQILDTIQASIERMARDIEQMEASFRDRDGEEWREKLALKILGEDDIPQRHDGESMDEYRARLEVMLIDQMLNDDGSIKDEYKNDPALNDYGQWAQKQYHLNSARVAVNEAENPNTSPERRDEILDELERRGDIEELAFADQVAAPESTIQGQIKDGADSVYDNNLDTESDLSERSNLFTPTGPR